MQKEILVFGAANVDFIIKSYKLPQKGEEIGGGQFKQTVGGKGVNQAISVARANGLVTFIGSVGDDIYSDKIVLDLMEAGVNTSHIILTPEIDSGVAMILVDEDGGNMISLAEGANAHFDSTKMNELDDILFTNAGMALVQMSIPFETIEALIEKCYTNDLPLVMNLAPAVKLRKELFEKVYFLIINEVECEFLTGVYPADFNSIQEAESLLKELGVNQCIINLGEKGTAYYTKEGQRGLIESYKVENVDSTSAGDSFIGYFMTKLNQGAGVEEAIKYGNAAGALAVTKFGTQSSIPRLEDVENML